MQLFQTLRHKELNAMTKQRLLTTPFGRIVDRRERLHETVHDCRQGTDNLTALVVIRQRF